MDNLFVRDRQVERKYLLEVIKCLRCLSRHGIPLQGHDGNGNFTQLSFISLERNNKSPIMNQLDGKLGHKHSHLEVQNELLSIMGALVLREKLFVIRDCKSFLIM